MAINADEDTEFNDALRKHGIIPPRTPPPRTPSPPPSPTLDDLLEGYTPKEMQELADDAQDDEGERVIEEYRRRRLAEMQREQRQARFGEVYPIGRDDYQREVTDASKVEEAEEGMEGKGTGVVCFLYKDGHVPSTRAFEHIRALAARHPRSKFVSIVGDKCIPNYPDRHLPTFFIYRKGEIINQYTAWGADRERKLEELEALFVLSGAIIPSQLQMRTDVRKRNDDDNSDGDDISDNEASNMRSSAAMTNGRAPKNIRGPARRTEDDDDSDFDL